MLSGGAARAASPLLVAIEVRADRVEMDSLVCELRWAANEGRHLLSEGMLSTQGPAVLRGLCFVERPCVESHY